MAIKSNAVTIHAVAANGTLRVMHTLQRYLHHVVGLRELSHSGDAGSVAASRRPDRELQVIGR